ncbi:MAG: SdpI family protein [Candidatus Kuenenbacteria bacterium]
MNIKKSEIIILGLILVSFFIGIYFYHQLPEGVWHTPDAHYYDSMSKFWGLFFMPFILVGLALLFIAIPRIDPLKENIEKFRKYYDRFVILFFVFMLSIHFQEILWNLGIKISSNLLPIGLGILFFYTGILCENTKRNWFIGIRTPWTLSNDIVWDKTHKIGGKLFKIVGVIAFVGIFFQNYLLFFISIPVILVAVYTIIYSYIEYRKEIK